MTETKVNPIDAALAKAEEIKEEQSTQDAQTIDAVPVTNPNTQVATHVQSGPITMMDQVASGGMSVTEWLKVKEFGLYSGSKEGKFFESFKAKIDTGMAGLAPFEGIRYGKKPVIYKKTFDKVNCASGGTWAAALEQGLKADPELRTYPGADITMKVLEDVKSGDEIVLTAGTTVGHSTAITNKGHLFKFYSDLQAANLAGKEVEVEVGFEKREGDGYNWGLITFTLIGPAS